MSAEEIKSSAASAFQAGDWTTAKEKYTQAIEMNPKDASSVANRSAVHLKAGELEEALTDAQLCRQMEPTRAIGYVREAAVLYEQSKFNEASVALEEGLTTCTDKAETIQLQRALRGARHSQLWSLPAAAAARKMRAAFQAAGLRQLAAEKETDPDVQNQHHRKMGLLVQTGLYSKDCLLEEMDQMLEDTHEGEGYSTQEVTDFLFYFLLYPAEKATLSTEIVKELLNEPFQFTEFEPPSMMDAVAFGKMMESVAEKAGATVGTVAESMIHQMTALPPTKYFCSTTNTTTLTPTTGSDVQPSTPAVTPDTSTTTTPTQQLMKSLFNILDKEGDSRVSFLDLSCGIYAWSRDQHPTHQTATRNLLLMDPTDDSRRLDYAQFGKFLLSLSSTWDESLEDVLDDLIVAFASGGGSGGGTKGRNSAHSEEVLKDIMVGGDTGGGGGNKTGTLDALTYTRCQQLFEVWDTDNDGSIDFAELLSGLRRYQQAATAELMGSTVGSANARAEKIALMMLSHDEDGNQTLDPEEFALAMVNYAKEADIDFHSLIDFMFVVIQKKEGGDAFEKAYSEVSINDGTVPRAPGRKIFRQHSILDVIADIEESEEESEEEE